MRPIRLFAATPIVVAALAAPSAQALDIAFSGSGVVQGPAPLPIATFNGLRIGPADASYTMAGEAGWTLDVAFEGQLAVSFASGAPVIGGWSGVMSGRFQRGADSIVFTGTQSSAAAQAPITLGYTVTGGTGLYAGMVGSGSSSVVLLGNPLGLPTPVPFQELNGSLSLQPVPEPAAWALLLAGGALVVATARRRVAGGDPAARRAAAGAA